MADQVVARRRTAANPADSASSTVGGSKSGGWNDNAGNNGDDHKEWKDVFDVDKDTRVPDSQLTLLEQLTVLSIQDTEGVIGFFLGEDEQHMRYILRAAVLIELALRNRIQLEPSRVNLSIFHRCVVVKNPAPCNDEILDEALKHIINTEEKENVEQWLALLCGDTFNPMLMYFQIKNLRVRIRKTLYDKGILSLGSTSLFGVISHSTYSIANYDVRHSLIKEVHTILFKECPADITKMEPRKLALLTMAYSSRVLESAFLKLNDQDYEKVFRRLQAIMDLDHEKVAIGHGTAWEVVWACIGCVADADY